MGETNVIPGILLLLAVMAALALAETVVPLRAAARRPGRIGANLALMLLFLVLNLLLTAAVLAVSLRLEQQHAGVLRGVGLSGVWLVVASVVVLDFFAYLVHVLLHKVPVLWRLHRVHHSDPDVDVTTAFRQHPMETLLRFVFTSVPAVLLGAPVEAVALYRVLSGVNALLEHANVRVPALLDRLLVLVVVTPHMHKIHHSRAAAETDSNYANILSVFDRIGGTFTPTARAAGVRYGLEEFDDGGDLRLRELLRLPWNLRPSPHVVAS